MRSPGPASQHHDPLFGVARDVLEAAMPWSGSSRIKKLARELADAERIDYHEAKRRVTAKSPRNPARCAQAAIASMSGGAAGH